MQLNYKLVSPKETVKALPGVGTFERKKSTYQLLIWLIIGIGIFFRLFHYIDNRSLWVDEIYLVTSIIKMNYLELATSSLDYQQKGPIGFLWLVRLCVDLFGEGEKALRLIPFLSGIASLFVFLPVAKRYLTPFAVVLAMGIVAFAPPLIYHSVEIKQYSTDFLVSVLSLYLFVRFQNDFRLSALLTWGVLGALLLWFSFPAIFMLAGIAIGASLYYLIKKDWQAFFRSIIPFSIWLISFAANYIFFTSKHADSAWLVSWFRSRQGFMPLEASVLGAVKWIANVLYRLLDYPLDVLWAPEVFASIDNTALRVLIKMGPVLMLFWAVGIYYFYKHNRKLSLVLVVPILLTLFAALINKYPFYERLVVFLGPIPILFLAQGCTQVKNYFASPKKWSYVFPVILLFWPLWSSASMVYDTTLLGAYKRAFYRDALLYIDERLQEGDAVYIYWNAKPAYRFYNQTYGLDLKAHELTDARFLVKNEHEYVEMLRAEYAPKEGVKRIWFIYEPFLMLEIGDFDGTPAWYHHEGIKGGDIIRKDLSTIGVEVDQFIGNNIGVSLYQVTQPVTEKSN